MKIKKSIILKLIIFISILLLYSIQILGEDTLYFLDEVVVTATRSEKKNFDLPMPISYIDEKRLEEISAPSVTEALEQIPGISLEKGGYWESKPIIRGLGGNRVLVLYDGDRETNLWAGRLSITPFIDVGSVSKIEVLKGPGSALYGTDALGGVINIITKEVAFADSKEWKFENKITNSYSSVNEGWFGHYDMTGGANGFGFRLGISGRDADNYEDGNGNEVNNSQFENMNIDMKTLYKITDNQKITASVRLNQIDDFGIPQKDPASPFSHFTRFDTQSYKLGYELLNFANIDNIKTKLFYVDQDRYYEGNYPSHVQPVHNLKDNQIDSSAKGASFQVQKNIADSNLLTSGVDFVREDTDSWETQFIHRNKNNSIARSMIFQPVPHANRNHLGLFSQDEIIFNDKLNFILGGRYDYFTTDADSITFTDKKYDEKGKLTSSSSSTSNFGYEKDSAVTFNLATLYKLTPNLHLTGTVSSGFRAPDIFERYSTRGGGSQILLGDPSLDSEYSYNFNTGIKARYSHLNAEFDIFYSRVNNYIDTILQPQSFVSGIPTYKYSNVLDAKLYGFDGNADFIITEKIKIFCRVAYVVGENLDNNERLNNIPPLNGAIGSRWESAFKNNFKYWFEIEGEFYNRQNHPAENESETAGYGIGNLRGGIMFKHIGILKDVKLTINAENLFDKYYLSHLRINDLDFIPEPGLNLTTLISFSF